MARGSGGCPPPSRRRNQWAERPGTFWGIKRKRNPLGWRAMAPCVTSPHPETDLPEAKHFRLCFSSLTAFVWRDLGGRRRHDVSCSEALQRRASRLSSESWMPKTGFYGGSGVWRNQVLCEHSSYIRLYAYQNPPKKTTLPLLSSRRRLVTKPAGAGAGVRSRDTR